MEYVPYLLTAYAIFAMAVMSPGPNFLAVTSASMTVSRRAGLGIALGHDLLVDDDCAWADRDSCRVRGSGDCPSLDWRWVSDLYGVHGATQCL